VHVLNLDLGFFLNDAVYHRSDDAIARPDDEDLVPWEADAVIRFLEDSLNLRELDTVGELLQRWRREGH
jgi:hypothetical protein